ncbi:MULTISPECIES: RnfABCDGE type electron transport complex subunit G [Prevotella]|uniref:Ion-translocating oxidoreductase complex subunit G n=1 Tax=Prevotella herbatica TaxID=2801997 RepID=A0ABN6EK70_9BACT|nr:MULTISPECIES: RnfABCDGE type electron transport complex subunit G [Prevotella]MDN5553011.1 RnfABCDGE type electron transport complex subunit G [Prevotella sp.]BCS86311.1 electron transport complex subunit G [Prevotella herbatica]
MEKLKSSLPNMVGVLVGFSIIIGGLLAYVNHITEGPIKQKQEKTLAAGIKTVMQNNNVQVADPETLNETIDGKVATFIIHPCKDNAGKNIGSAIESTTNGFGGDLQVLVGFDNDGKILGYTILKSSETPGLGAKAGVWFQKDGKGNVIGMSPKDKPLVVSKDGGDVDAITASTITSRAFLKAINQAYAAYAKKK